MNDYVLNHGIFYINKIKFDVYKNIYYFIMYDRVNLYIFFQDEIHRSVADNNSLSWKGTNPNEYILTV